MTSCGAGPDGMRATTFRVEGSTIASVVSPFDNTSSALTGVLSARILPEMSAARRNTELSFKFVASLAILRNGGQGRGDEPPIPVVSRLRRSPLLLRAPAPVAAVSSPDLF